MSINALLLLPSVRGYVSGVAASQLEALFGNKVEIGNVQNMVFSRFDIRDVVFYDLKGDSLFHAKKIAVAVDFFSLFKKQIEVSNCQLINTNFYCSKDSLNGVHNFQFVVDRLASKDSVKKPFDYRISLKNIIIKNGHLSYKVVGVEHPEGKFSVNDLDVSKLNANISLKEFSKDTINAHIKRLGFEEKSGFRLKQLSIQVQGNREDLVVRSMKIELPHTLFQTDSLRIRIAKADSVSNPLHSAQLEFATIGSYINPSDFKVFYPPLSNLDLNVHLRIAASGSLSEMNIHTFELESGHDVVLSTSGAVSNMKEMQQAELNLNLKSLHLSAPTIERLFRTFTPPQVHFPPLLANLGDVRVSGFLNGGVNNLNSRLNLSASNIGTLHTALSANRINEENLYAIKAEVGGSKLQIDKLIGGENDLGLTSFTLAAGGTLRNMKEFVGSVNANVEEFEFKEYRYTDISAKGTCNNNRYEVNVTVDDPNVDFAFEGSLNMGGGRSQELKASLLVNKLKFKELNITSAYGDANLSLMFNSEIEMHSDEDVLGLFEINNLLFTTDQQKLFYDNITLKADTLDNGTRRIKINSGIAEGLFEGKFKLMRIPAEIMKLSKTALPSIIPGKANAQEERCSFTYSLTVHPTAELSKVLRLPFTLAQPLTLAGTFDNEHNTFQNQLFYPELQIGAMKILGGQIYSNQKEGEIDLTTRLCLSGKKDINISLFTHAKSDTVSTSILWSANGSSTLSGELMADAAFNRNEENSLSTKVQIHPSFFVVNDTTWRIDPARLYIEGTDIEIDKIAIAGENQFLKINGKISKSDEDSLMLSLKDISLDYIFEIVKIKNVAFGGRATADLVLSNVFSSPIAKTNNLSVKEFVFNDCKLGDIEVKSNWNNELMRVSFDASLTNELDSVTTIDGFYAVPNDSLVLDIHASELDVAFLRPFIDNVLQNLSGRASGNVLLYGRTKDLTVRGGVLAHHAGFDIGILNTSYTFADSVLIHPTAFELKGVKVYDKDSNFATVNGLIKHEYFRDITYNVNIQTDRLFAYNRKSLSELPFGGSVYASGEISIVGDEKVTDITANVRSESNSSFFYSLDNKSTTSSHRFVEFVKPRDLYEESLHMAERVESQVATPIVASGTVTNMNIQMDVNPNLSTEIIMDEATGDVIKATGNGDIRVEYSTATNDLKMYGGYTIDRGSYSFSLQSVITKVFTIADGSSIKFNGKNLNNIEMDIKAGYTIPANVADLDESLTIETSRTVMPVHCDLKITGNISKPVLNFDISIPSASTEINRRVRTLISSEDMMNRQIIYLLVLGKFYTPEYMNVSGSKNNEMAALASSAVSSQLNNLLGNMIDNWNIGTNFRSQKGDFSDIEMEVALQGQLLDNRLLINGNFGYRDKRYSVSQTSFIGDIDVEYKLTKSGIYRVKAYSHSNDKFYYYKPALTTQGIGFVFKKELAPYREKRKKKRERQVQTEEESRVKN